MFVLLRMRQLALPIAATALGAGTLLLGACRPPEPPVRVGALVWPPYELFFVAREQGFLAEDQVELVQYRSPIDSVRAYQNGALDAVLITADFALRVAETDPDSRIVLVVDFSQGGDAVVAQPEIGSVEDLAGRRVGVELSSLGLYVFRRALDRHGMGLDDVEVVPVDYPELPSAYAEDRVDAVVVFEPERTLLLNRGARQIFSSAEIPDEIVDVLLVRGDILDSRTRTLRDLVDGWFRARTLLHRQPELALPVMAARERLTEDELRAALTGVEIPDREINRRLLSGEGSSLDVALGRLAAFLADQQLLPPNFDPAPYLDDRLVREAPR